MLLTHGQHDKSCYPHSTGQEDEEQKAEGREVNNSCSKRLNCFESICDWTAFLGNTVEDLPCVKLAYKDDIHAPSELIFSTCSEVQSLSHRVF